MGFSKPKVVQAPPAPEPPIVHPTQQVVDVSSNAENLVQQQQKRKYKLESTVNRPSLGGGSLRKTLG